METKLKLLISGVKLTLNRNLHKLKLPFVRQKINSDIKCIELKVSDMYV